MFFLFGSFKNLKMLIKFINVCSAMNICIFLAFASNHKMELTYCPSAYFRFMQKMLPSIPITQR